MSEVAYIGPGGRDRRPRPLLRDKLGDALRRRRLDQGRTLADVARAARVSLPYLSEVECGRKEASSEVLAALCDALRVELSDLLSDIGRELARERGPVGLRRPVGAGLTRLEPARPAGTPRRAQPPTGRAGDVLLLAA